MSPPESDDKVTTRYQGGTIGDSTVCMPRGACLTAHALVDRQGGMEGEQWWRKSSRGTREDQRILTTLSVTEGPDSVGCVGAD